MSSGLGRAEHELYKLPWVPFMSSEATSLVSVIPVISDSGVIVSLFSWCKSSEGGLGQFWRHGPR